MSLPVHLLSTGALVVVLSVWGAPAAPASAGCDAYSQGCEAPGGVLPGTGASPSPGGTAAPSPRPAGNAPDSGALPPVAGVEDGPGGTSAGAPVASDRRHLPVTGRELSLIALCGLAALAVGSGLVLVQRERTARA